MRPPPPQTTASATGPGGRAPARPAPAQGQGNDGSFLKGLNSSARVQLDLPRRPCSSLPSTPPAWHRTNCPSHLHERRRGAVHAAAGVGVPIVHRRLAVLLQHSLQPPACRGRCLGARTQSCCSPQGHALADPVLHDSDQTCLPKLSHTSTTAAATVLPLCAARLTLASLRSTPTIFASVSRRPTAAFHLQDEGQEGGCLGEGTRQAALRPLPTAA